MPLPSRLPQYSTAINIAETVAVIFYSMSLQIMHIFSESCGSQDVVVPNGTTELYDQVCVMLGRELRI